MSPARDPHDPQGHRVHALETQLDGMRTSTCAGRQYLRDVAAAVCAKAGIPAVQLVFKAMRGNYLGTHYAGTIRLNTRKACHGANLYILLHELAHAICDDYHDAAANHGPEFCAIFRSLLHDYKILPKVCFDVLARKGGVKVQRIEYDFI